MFWISAFIREGISREGPARSQYTNFLVQI